MAILIVFGLVLMVGPAMAQSIIPQTIFPYKMGEADVPLYPVDPESMCTTDIIDSVCQVNTDGGTLVNKDVPFTGSVDYSGSASGEVAYSGNASYSGTVDYSGSAPFSGSLPMEASGTVPFNAYNKSGYATFTYAVTAPVCEPLVDKGCCSAKGNPEDGSVTLVCQKIDPTMIVENGSFQYDICEEATFDVPWSYAGTANYNGDVPFSGKASYSGSVPYSGTVPYDAPYSGSVPFNGTVQAQVKEFAPTDVIYSEGNVLLDCPEQDEVVTQAVQFKELVTNACVGETIQVEATGYTYGVRTIQYRIVVHYKPSPGAPYSLVLRTDREKAVVNGTFKDQLEDFTFTKAGIYRFLFRVWKPDGQGGWALAGQAVNRTVTATECPAVD